MRCPSNDIMHIFCFFILNLFFDDQHALMDICDDRFQRPPGALPSSMLGYEALTGSLDDFGFEDYLNSKKFYPLFSISQLRVVLHVHPSILLQPTTTLLIFLVRLGENWYVLFYFLILIVGQQLGSSFFVLSKTHSDNAN